MQTTLDIPDALYRDVEASAAASGQSFAQFVQGALAEKVDSRRAKKNLQGWRKALGTLSPEAKAAARELDPYFRSPEFRKIDPEVWQ